MQTFSMELAKAILNLEMQKEKLISENDIRLRLCECRLKMLKNYIHVCQLMSIRFTSKVIKFMEDFERDKSNVRDLKSWYYTEMYDKLYISKSTSSKMILLFRLLQDKVDEEFFSVFESKYDKIIKEFDENEFDEFKARILNIMDDIQDWMEEHILGLLSLKIDCDNIDDSIITDLGYILEPKKGNEKFKCECSEPDNCQSKHLYDSGEVIHLYITNESIEDKSICAYMDLIIKYHTNIKNISVIADFQLLDHKVTCDGIMIEKLESVIKNFKNLSIINYDLVDFSEKMDLVGKYLKNERDIDGNP